MISPPLQTSHPLPQRIRWRALILLFSLSFTPLIAFGESTLVSQAKLYLEEGYPFRAINLLEEAIREGNEESVVARLLAEIYYNRSRLSDALPALNRARRLASTNDEREALRSIDENWRARYGVVNLQLLGGGEGQLSGASLRRRGRLLNQHKRSVLEEAQRQIEGGISLPNTLWLPHGQYTLIHPQSDEPYMIVLSTEAGSFSLELPSTGAPLAIANDPPGSQESTSGRSALYWSLGGVALAVAVSVFFLQPEEEQPATSYQLSFE